MRRVMIFMAATTLWLCVLVAFSNAQGQQPQGRQAQAGRQGGAPAGGGWTLPPTAAAEKSPLTVNDGVIAGGKKLYVAKCQRCHGTTGKGDGPDGEPEHQDDMDLTVASRAAKNPDGTVFYKIWNGRTTPKMEKMSEELTKEQVWAVVAYVQTLRGK
jgi:mono/diheme cytochrome c family protein